MAGKVTSKFKIHNANQFKEQFDESEPSNIYFFIGKSTPWPSDDSPPTANDTVSVIDYRTYDSILSMKKIQPSDVTFSIPRYDWSAGTVYTMYRFNEDLTDLRYYVITDDFNVYKCLYNNGGAPSTVKPTGQLTTSITTSDGYVWKYMYSVTAGEAIKFVTANYIPVKTLTTDDGSLQWDVQEAAQPGNIEIVEVTNGGANWRTNSGTLTAANSSTATLAASASSTTNFYVDNSIYISSGTGAGQIRKITSYDGVNKVAFIDSAWAVVPDTSSVYSVTPTITVTGDGQGFTGVTTVANNAITKVTTLNTGNTYTFANVVFTGNGGSGAAATAHISPIKGHGADPVEELHGYNIMFNLRLSGTESNTFMVGNEFRQIGLLLDPVLTSNGAVATGSIYNQTTKLDMSGITGTFINDEMVTGSTSGATAKVVEYSGNNQISVVEVTGVFQTGETLNGANSLATGTIATINEPPISKYSGKILYLENRTPITRNASQAEDFKTIISFE